MELIFRPEDIPDGGQRFTFSLDKASLEARVGRDKELADRSSLQPPAFSFPSGPTVDAHVTASGETVYVSGSTSYEFVTPCARCAEDARVECELKIKVVLKPHKSGAEEDDDIELSYYSGDEIELQSVIEDFIVLNIPYVSHCKSDCKGLCVSCGANLNAGLCSCPSEVADERFAALRGLKIQ